ncbi:hypothetical protein SprV_0501838300 [Sparganum proliferum]
MTVVGLNFIANTSPIATFGTCSNSVDVGFRRLFPWAFVLADIPCAILGADFLAAFDLLVDCRHFRLLTRTPTSLSGESLLLTLRVSSPSWTLNSRSQLGNSSPNKVQRHIKAPIGTFPTSDARFSHVHLDIVGPLSLSNGCSHIFTCVDRFTRWPEAILLPDVAILTVVEDCSRIRITVHHRAAKGMVKRFQRQLKTSLRATDDPENRTGHIFLVLLGILSLLKSDLDFSAAELVFGGTVRLTYEVISPTLRGATEDPNNLLHRLRETTCEDLRADPFDQYALLGGEEAWKDAAADIDTKGGVASAGGGCVGMS